MLVDDLFDYTKDNLKETKAVDVRIGLSYTGVLLESNRLGLSRSFREEANSCCEVIDEAGELERNALELAKFAFSSRAVDSSVGFATMNAVLNQEVKGEEGALLNFLEIREGDKVGMVGNFKPVIEKLDKKIDLSVFERDSRDEEVYPDWAAEQILPGVDVALITGTAVVNKTMDHLLELSRNAREIAILGPTTPMAPEIFEKHGATFLGGMTVEDPEQALKIISQGGGTRRLKDVCQKVTVSLK